MVIIALVPLISMERIVKIITMDVLRLYASTAECAALEIIRLTVHALQTTMAPFVKTITQDVSILHV